MKARLILFAASTFALTPLPAPKMRFTSNTAFQATFDYNDRRAFCQGLVATTVVALVPALGLPVFADEGTVNDSSSMAAEDQAKKARDKPPTADRFAILEWDASNEGMCFCDPKIRLDIRKVQPTPKTIGAIFGLSNDVERIRLYDTMDDVAGELVPVEDNQWSLQGGNCYRVVYDGQDYPPCSIGEIYSFLGLTEDKVHNMSLQFYRGIWADDSDDDFRSHFVRSVSSPLDAADNQARWLIETWGGPKSYTEKHGDNVLEKRMRSKHSSSKRMTYQHACLWLDHMRAVVNNMFPDEQARRVLGMFWAHVYGFFPFSDEERAGIRKRVFDINSDSVLLGANLPYMNDQGSTA